LIDCDDNDPNIIDTCDPRTGCKFVNLFDFANPNGTPDPSQAISEDSYFYEDETTLAFKDQLAIISWLKSEVSQIPCTAGEVLTACPDGKEKIGALCYSPCQEGYSCQGTLDCQQECLEGWQDDGLFCRLAEYGHGAGYPWNFGDPLNDS